MRAVTGLLLLGAACTSATGPGSHPSGMVVASPTIGARPFAVAISAQNLVYVGRQDVPFLQITSLPDLSFGDSVRVGLDPTDIAFHPGGTVAYVTNQFSGTVGIVNVGSGTMSDSIDVTGDPFRVLVARNGAELLVSTNTDSVYEISVATKAVLRRWGFSAPVNGMTLAAGGALLYLTDINGDLYKVSVGTTSTRDSVHIGGKLQDVTLSLDGAELYVANEIGALEVRDPATLSQVTTVPAASGAFGLVLTPDGTELYATVPAAGQVKIVERTARTVRTLSVGGTPRRIAFDRLGTTALIPNESGFVTVIQ